MAKAERASRPESRLHDIHLKALAPFVSPDLKVDANNWCGPCYEDLPRPHQGCLPGPETSVHSLPSQVTLRRSRPLLSPPGSPKQYATPMTISPTTRRITSRSELTTYGPSPPAGMPCSGFPCTTSYGQLSGALTPLSPPFTSRTSRWWKRTF